MLASQTDWLNLKPRDVFEDLECCNTEAELYFLEKSMLKRPSRSLQRIHIVSSKKEKKESISHINRIECVHILVQQEMRQKHQKQSVHLKMAQINKETNKLEQMSYEVDKRELFQRSQTSFFNLIKLIITKSDSTSTKSYEDCTQRSRSFGADTIAGYEAVELKLPPFQLKLNRNPKIGGP
ncbi:hypothetical protein EGR_04613 [Echinococcus granulosus]|uniref:Uncharacterized protein n=1 Tax=Echinococcus granulosus TaxID=6210 RepID=W6V3J0_ECHGR|nr:hypothetical protein EGR_04613 [Echinococcus granulosus]EUB60594.1 hypothetical protein EGR_04613 [Echinococcus granulosus]